MAVAIVAFTQMEGLFMSEFTPDEIIEMARQAGYLDLSLTDRGMELKELEAFAKLVAEREREAFEKLCDKYNFGIAPMMIKKAIRARGES